MVDRVMRAMSAYADTLPKTSDDAPFIYSHRKGLALAAIAALREPTEAMLDIGVAAYDQDEYHMSTFHCLGEAWKAMIDAALKD